MPSTQIDVEPGGTAWRRAAPLLEAVWPPEVVATLPWRAIVWAHADQRVLVSDERGDVVCHVGLFLRQGLWDDRLVRIGGIGGVATRADSRKRGLATVAMQRAVHEMRDVHRVDFGLLFCEPRHVAFYQRLGWHAFDGEVFADQPQGRVRFEVTRPMIFDLALAPRTGVLDLCGLPW